MSTPGAIKRYVLGSWLQEGSYILAVANVAALPAAPADDQVWAFAKATHELYYSEARAWVKYAPTGGGATNLDSLTDVTIASPANGQHVVYESASGQWKNVMPSATPPGTIIHQGQVALDLGSQTAGGLRDMAQSNFPTFTVPCLAQFWGAVQFGFGVSAVVVDVDMIRVRDGGTYDSSVGHTGAPAGTSLKFPVMGYDTIAVGVNGNAKVRINGINFAGGNCYMSSYIKWIVTAQ